MKTLSERLFRVVFTWTIITTVFAWLPLVRIFARPEGYQWGLFGLRGVGRDGPFGVFVVLTVYAFVMLCYGQRIPKIWFYVLLLVWHFALTGYMVVSIASMGASATLQGQGLRFEIPLYIISLPAVLFTGLVAAWIVLDYREHSPRRRHGWSPANTRKLVAAIVLLLVAIVLFRFGTNYDWVTALAIVVTIMQWILLVEAFQPVTLSSMSDAE